MYQNLSPGQLIDSDVSDLVRLQFLFNEDSDELKYIQIMIAYYLNDIAKLERYSKDLTNESSEENIFFTLCKLRLAILKKTNLNPDTIDISHLQKSPYLGDVYFCLALICAAEEKHQLVKDNFLAAYKQYTRVGAIKKSLNARMNTITAEGNIDINKRLLANYLESVDILIDAQSNTSAANILVNISDEFYKIGALNSSYQYISQAIKILGKQPNTIQYYEALSHLCETLFQMKQLTKAKEVLTEIKKANFFEIQELIKVIESNHLNICHEINQKNLSPAWKIRHNNSDIPSHKILGATADSLVNLLAHKEAKIVEITEALYPNIDEYDARNRLTTMISRINKSYPNLIIFDSSRQSFKLSHNEPLQFKGRSHE